MTTNIDVNKLDPALVRSGRVDYHLEFKHVDRAQAEKMFLRFYQKKVMRFLEDNDDDDNYSDSELRELAKSFSEKVIGDTTACAADIQSHLIRFKRDPRAALNKWGEI